jgi:hypothetical protein
MAKRKTKRVTAEAASPGIPPRSFDANLGRTLTDFEPSPRGRKLEVFVGSTFKEHIEYRRAVLDAILEAGHIPSGMELWESESTPLLDTIASKLYQCDVHILLIGRDYGAYVNDDPDASDEDRISFTEWEYRQSERAGRPIIAFVADDAAQRSSRNKRSTRTNEEDKRKQAQFERFRSSVQTRFCHRYKMGRKDAESAQELSRHVTNSLHQLENAHILSPDAGWLRADSVEALQARAIRENRFLARIMARLRQFSLLTERVLAGALEKEMAAVVFWHTLTGPIRRTGRRRIFFESGSTLAFVSEVFERAVLDNSAPDEEWRIWTNNVESLLQLELYSNARVVSFPSDAPILGDKYGAIFSKSFLGVYEAPPTKGRRLYTQDDYQADRQDDRESGTGTLRNGLAQRDCVSEQSLVEQTTEQLRSELADCGLVCVTASGLDDNVEEDWQRGPHIGSHENMLFKRAVYDTGEPTVIFLHWEKIQLKRFRPGTCYPVFLDDYDWTKFVETRPVAICIGYRTSKESPDDLTGNQHKTLNDPAVPSAEEVETFCRNNGLTRRLEHAIDERNGVGAALFANDKFSRSMSFS